MVVLARAESEAHPTLGIARIISFPVKLGAISSLFPYWERIRSSVEPFGILPEEYSEFLGKGNARE